MNSAGSRNNHTSSGYSLWSFKVGTFGVTAGGGGIESGMGKMGRRWEEDGKRMERGWIEDEKRIERGWKEDGKRIRRMRRKKTKRSMEAEVREEKRSKDTIYDREEDKQHI